MLSHPKIKGILKEFLRISKEFHGLSKEFQVLPRCSRGFPRDFLGFLMGFRGFPRGFRWLLCFWIYILKNTSDLLSYSLTDGAYYWDAVASKKKSFDDSAVYLFLQITTHQLTATQKEGTNDELFSANIPLVEVETRHRRSHKLNNHHSLQTFSGGNWSTFLPLPASMFYSHFRNSAVTLINIPCHNVSTLL